MIQREEIDVPQIRPSTEGGPVPRFTFPYERAGEGLARFEISARGHLPRYVLAESVEQAEAHYRQLHGLGEGAELQTRSLPD